MKEKRLLIVTKKGDFREVIPLSGGGESSIERLTTLLYLIKNLTRSKSTTTLE